MQENVSQVILRPPLEDQQQSHSPSSVPATLPSPNSPKGLRESPKCNPNTLPVDGRSSSSERSQFRRGSSPESIESNNYAIPVKYRSAVGTFEEHIAYGFGNLFNSSVLSDVTIVCEGKLMKAHKLVLALSSPYFRQIFEELHDYPCQHPVVILHGVKLKDWDNLMRLIYFGMVHISSSEVDAFISTAECLKIDGLFAEDPNSCQEDGPPSDEYLQRLTSTDFQEERDAEEGGGPNRGRDFMQQPYSPEDFHTAQYERIYEDVDQCNSNYEQSLLMRYRRGHNSGVTSSAQSSPGGMGARDPVKLEAQEGYGQARPPSCPERLRLYSQTTSPPASLTRSNISSIRHPVISRRQESEATSEPTDDVFEVPIHRGTDFASAAAAASRMPILTRYPINKMSPYHQTCWEPRAPRSSLEEREQSFQPVVCGTRSPGPGVTTKYPLSVISRRPPPAMPHQFLSQGPGFIQRIPQLLQGTSASSGADSKSHGTVIIPAPNAHSHQTYSPQMGEREGEEQQQQQSTLSILKAKIAAGQQIYSRGYRSDRQQQQQQQYHSQSHQIHPFNLHRSAASVEAESSRNQHGHESIAGPSGNLFQNINEQQTIARPKTKAIRSSQVPQSARYTAAEVDAMVDKVQNFPGNMVPCAVCSKFVKRERLRAHIHECHLLFGKRIVCPHCGIGLKSKGSYRVHIWRHKRGSLPQSRNTST